VREVPFDMKDSRKESVVFGKLSMSKRNEVSTKKWIIFFGYGCPVVSKALALAGGGESPPEEMQLEAPASLVWRSLLDRLVLLEKLKRPRCFSKQRDHG